MVEEKGKRLLVFSFSCLLNFSTSGLLLGFAALSPILTTEEGKGGGGVTAAHAHEIFVASSTCGLLSPLLLGALLDATGPRLTVCFSLLMVSSGLVICGTNSLMAGFVLLSIGGPGVQSGIIHTSNLFPQKKGLATSVITGSFQLSSTIFLLFNVLWQNTPLVRDFSTLFIGYGCFVVALVVMAALVMPSKPYSLKEEIRETLMENPGMAAKFEEKTEEELRSVITLPSVYMKHHKHPVDPSPHAHAALRDASFMVQILSPEFFRLTMLLSLGVLWANFFVGALPTILDDQNLEERAVSRLLQAFTAIASAGGMGIPVIGILMDKFGFPQAALATITLGALFTLGIAVRNQVVLVISFIAYSLFRTFLFSFFFGYVAHTFGFEFFGVLSGVSLCVAGVVGLLQHPLLALGRGGNWGAISFAQLLCFAGLYLMVAYEYVHQQNTRKDRPYIKSQAEAVPLQSAQSQTSPPPRYL